MKSHKILHRFDGRATSHIPGFGLHTEKSDQGQPVKEGSEDLFFFLLTYPFLIGLKEDRKHQKKGESPSREVRGSSFQSGTGRQEGSTPNF